MNEARSQANDQLVQDKEEARLIKLTLSVLEENFKLGRCDLGNEIINELKERQYSLARKM